MFATPVALTRDLIDDIDQLAHGIAVAGIDHFEAEVAAVAEVGRQAGIRQIADIAVDPAAPAVARERAFGELAWRLAQLQRQAAATGADQFITAA